VQTFEYIALSAAGARVKGELVGPTEQAVLAELEARQLVPVSVEPKAAGGMFSGLGGGSGGRRISARKLGTSYRQVAELLHAGVPLLRSLRLLANRRSDPRLAAVFRDLADGVSGGEDLAGTMSKKPEVFPIYHVAMVRAGEKGGFLETVMGRLGQVVLKQAEIRAQIAGSLIYPAVLVTAGLVILTLVFGLFVPKFKENFARFEGNLPLITRVVLGIGDAVGKYGLVTAVILAVLAIIAWRLLKLPKVKRRIAEWRTRGPVVGPLVRSLSAARFCRLLGTMLASGVPVLAAMGIAKDAAGNQLMEEAIEKAAESVKAGQPLAAPLGESKLFDDDVIEMISVAETANNLESVLVSVADTLEQRIDRMLAVALRLIEPLLILAIALVVAAVAAALILPMTKLGGSF
jgi:general secretion pathway protein F/type IV pilus assembly protein PilC